MAKRGFQLFTFAVHRPRKASDVLTLGELSGKLGESREATELGGLHNDALSVFAAALRGMNQRVQHRDKHFRILRVQGAGRYIEFTAEIGTSEQQSTFFEQDQPVFQRKNLHVETTTHRALFDLDLAGVPPQDVAGERCIEHRKPARAAVLNAGQVECGVQVVHLPHHHQM